MSAHRLASKQVLTCYQGSVEIAVAAPEANLEQKPSDASVEWALFATKIIVNGTATAWDSYAMPADVWRSYRNTGSADAVLLVMSPGDARKPVEWPANTLAAAGQSGFAIDANGYIALKKFTDRSQK